MGCQYGNVLFLNKAVKLASGCGQFSQSSGRDIVYPPGVQHIVQLTEVVRSSQRIVAGAAAFQLGENKARKMKVLSESHKGRRGKQGECIHEVVSDTKELARPLLVGRVRLVGRV